jgi:tetratricopeptide (TPR) repeat protein
MSSEQAYTTIEHAAQTGNLTPNVEAAIDLVLQDKITLPPAKAAKALARIGIAYGVNGRTELADRIIALSVRQCKKCGETDLEGPAAQLQWHTKEEGLALLTEHMQAYRSGTARERAVPWGLHNLRATLHRQMGQPDEALEDYETMTMANLRSKFREASLGWIGQTEVYLEKKDLAKAKQCLQEWRKIATDERPDRLLFEPSILELTGRVQEAEGRHLEALKSYHGCIDAASMLHMGKPRNHPQKSFVHHAVSAAHTGAGRMQELRGDYDSALKHYIAAIKAAKPTGDSELLRIRQKEHDDAIARLGPGTPTAK